MKQVERVVLETFLYMLIVHQVVLKLELDSWISFPSLERGVLPSDVCP